MEAQRSEHEAPMTDASTEQVTYLVWVNGHDGRLTMSPVAGTVEQAVRTFGRLQDDLDKGRITIDPDSTDAVIPSTPGTEFRGALPNESLREMAELPADSRAVIDDAPRGGDRAAAGDPVTALIGEHPRTRMPVAFLVAGDLDDALPRFRRFADGLRDRTTRPARIESFFESIERDEIAEFEVAIGIDQAVTLNSMAYLRTSESAGTVLTDAELDRLEFEGRKAALLETINGRCDSAEAIDALDGVTHEAAETEAAQINNGGYVDQVNFLFANGVDSARILAAVELPAEDLDSADTIARRIDAAGPDDGDEGLDDAYTELVMALGDLVEEETTRRASRANNEGLDGQIDYLLRAGEDEQSILERVAHNEEPQPMGGVHV